jgi:hypothetical protein
VSHGIAVSIVPGELRLLVARTNGAARPLHQLAAELPEGAVRPGLQAPNLAAGEAVAEALSRLAKEAAATPERRGMLAVLIPDAAVRMALVPLEGGQPRRAEAEAMARWALRDLLPVAAEEARVDWALLSGDGNGGGNGSTTSWLLALGADAAVIKEYEAAVEKLGGVVGRVVPFTLALAAGAGAELDEGEAGTARLVLCGAGGQMACLVEAAGVPRFHRAWRGVPPDMDLELPGIQRYVAQRLELEIVEAVVAGPEGWRQRAATACEALGWQTHLRSSWTAHIGAVQP